MRQQKGSNYALRDVGYYPEATLRRNLEPLGGAIDHGHEGAYCCNQGLRSINDIRRVLGS
jgi:hypothetical protein